MLLLSVSVCMCGYDRIFTNENKSCDSSQSAQQLLGLGCKLFVNVRCDGVSHLLNL